MSGALTDALYANFVQGNKNLQQRANLFITMRDKTEYDNNHKRCSHLKQKFMEVIP